MDGQIAEFWADGMGRILGRWYGQIAELWADSRVMGLHYGAIYLIYLYYTIRVAKKTIYSWGPTRLIRRMELRMDAQLDTR